MMTIILDLDDVLANLRESIYQTLTKATGIDYHWRHWGHYDLGQHYKVGRDHLVRILVDGRILEACEPEPGATVITCTLKKLGFQIVIVTARGWHPQAERITREWLKTYGIHHDALIVVPLGANKLEVLGPFQDITLAVDDHPANVARYQSAGIPTLLMDRPWNLDFDGERIFSLEDLLVYVRARAGAGEFSG